MSSTEPLQENADIVVLVDEVEWRMRQFDREQCLRASLLPPPDSAIVEEFLDRLRAPLRSVTRTVIGQASKPRLEPCQEVRNAAVRS